MNVAIHTFPVSSGHSSRGIGVYTRLLLKALQTYVPEHTYTTVTSASECQHTDIIHYPYFDPFFLTLPFFSPKPTIVTVHDLIPLVFPDKFPKGIRGAIKWEIQKQSLQRKQRVITDSHCSKKDIMTIVGIPNERIDVVPLAPSLSSLYMAKTKNPLSDPYFLYVGDINWNKNIWGLLEAFALFRKNHKEIKLVLVGKAFVDHSLKEAIQIQKHIKALDIEQSVLMLGFVTEKDLIALYRHALSFIQPSYYEGFGFSVLDAMAAGCLVITSTAASLEEIRGPGLGIDPYRQETFIAAMEQVFTMSTSEKEVYIRKGYAWVKRFTWQETAKRTGEAYEKVLA